MSARKNRPVLFEVSRRMQLSKPSARTRPTITPAAAPPRGAPDDSPPTLPLPRPARSSEPVSPLRLRGSGYEVSLEWPGLALLGGILLLLLIFTFYLGTLMGGGGAPIDSTATGGGEATITSGKEPQTERDGLSRRRVATPVGGAGAAGAQPEVKEQRAPTAEQPDKPSPAQPGAADLARGAADPANAERDDSAKSDLSSEVIPPPEASPAPAVVDLKPGYSYVVVQHFRRTKEQDAHAAAEYLQANGIAVALLPSASEIRLIAIEGFWTNQRSADAARRERDRMQKLRTKVRELGKQYEGGYAFDQAYEMKVPLP